MLGHYSKGSTVRKPSLRLAEPDDAWVLSRIDQASFRDYLPAGAYRSLIWTAGLTVRIIRNEMGHSAGLVVTEHRRGYIEIVRLAVRPVDRRCGLATMVLETMQRNLPRSCQIIAKIELTGEMIPAIRRFEKLGFFGLPMPECADVIRFEWRHPYAG